MWLDLLKALPQKEAIEPMLLDDRGSKALIGMAKLRDKKGLKNAVDETKRLSEGNISTNYNKEDRDKIIENAEKAYKALKEILEEYRKETQPGKMTGRVKEILKDWD